MMDREAFQEIDYRQMFGPVAKWAAQIDVTARIPEYMARAFHIATSGRPGPVVLALAGGHADRSDAVWRCGCLSCDAAGSRSAGLAADPRTARGREEADDPGRRSRLERPRLRPVAGLCRGQRHSGRDLVPPPGHHGQPVVLFRRRSRHLRAARTGAALQGSRFAVRDRRAARRNDHPGLQHPFGAEGPAETGPCPCRRQRTRKSVHARHRGAVIRQQFSGGAGGFALVRRGSLERLAQCRPHRLSQRGRSTRLHAGAGPRSVHARTGQTARRQCHRHARRRQSHRLAAALSDLRAAGPPDRAHQRRDGLFGAGGGRGVARLSGPHRDRLRRRWRLHDERTGNFHRRAARRQADHPFVQQQHVRHHPHASGARASLARGRNRSRQSRLCRHGAGDGRACRAHHPHRGFCAGARARASRPDARRCSNSAPIPSRSRRGPRSPICGSAAEKRLAQTAGE